MMCLGFLPTEMIRPVVSIVARKSQPFSPQEVKNSSSLPAQVSVSSLSVFV